MSAVNGLTDAQCSLWYCECCFKSGALGITEGAGVYEVIEALDAAHKAKSPDCDALIGNLRIARPNSWYADTLTAQRSKRSKC